MYFLRFGKLVITLIYLILYYAACYLIPFLWNSNHFIRTLSSCGTLIIKLGQILSVRPDICGTTLSSRLINLRRTVTPIDLDLYTILTDKIKQDLTKFKYTPIACGSIAQVYCGTLLIHGTNKKVVFKILKPGIIQQINEDLCILRVLAQWIDYLRPVWRAEACLHKLSEYIIKQTDLLLEKDNLIHFKNQDYNTPTVYMDYCSSNILCMEYLESTNIKEEEKHTLYSKLCKKMLTAPCFLHLDLHPGNVIYSKGNIYLIDVGLAQHIDEELYQFFMSTLMVLVSKKYVQFGKLFIQGNDIPKGWLQFIESLFPQEDINPAVIMKIFISIIGSCHKYNVSIDERMSSIVMALIVINGHYNELCLKSGKKEDFIKDILFGF